MDTIIERNLTKCKELEALCTKENRNPTSEERKYANQLLAEIEIKESGNFFNKDEFPGLANTMPNNPETRSSQKPYELRTAGDKKDFRNLYGSSKDEYHWTDKESNFFEALFSGRFHPGLVKRSLSENVPSQGGFLIPAESVEKIHNVALENELVMPLATVQPMKTNSITIPAVEIGDHSVSLFGGFTATYKAEAATLSEANPTFRAMELNCNKLTGFLKFSNELMNDVSNGESQILDICGKGLAWYRDKSWLTGIGAGEPLGILNAGCLLSQEKASGQMADTIIYDNLTGMMAKMFAGSFANSVWVCHQSTIPQLLQLSLAIGTGGDHVPVLQESSGEFKMLTRPVIFTEKTEPLGSKGDVCLFDFSQYLIGMTSEMRIDLSQHIYFTTDQGAARLIERHDGQPLWDKALTLKDGSTEVSPFVTLDARE